MKRKAKKTYTFATHEETMEKAKKKAKKEGITISEKIDEFLKEYIGQVSIKLSTSDHDMG